MIMRPNRTSPRRAASPRVLACWYGSMALAGFGFGLLAERRPFGEDVLAHPLVLFFVAAGLGLN
jgi:hypothetical protein